MSGRLEGKNIVVTAAGQGIGKATAIAFCNEGAKYSITQLSTKPSPLKNTDNLLSLSKSLPTLME